MKEIKKINNKVFNVILICIFILILCYTLMVTLPVAVCKNMQNAKDEKISNLVSLDEVSQSFKAVDSYLSSIDIQVSTEYLKNTSTIEFTLKDEDGDIVEQKEIDSSDFVDNKLYSVSFEPQKYSAGKTYTAYFKPKNITEGDKIYFYASKGNQYEEGVLLVNGKEQLNDLAFSTTYRKGRILNVKDSLKKLPVNGKMFIVISLVMTMSLTLFVYKTTNKFDK